MSVEIHDKVTAIGENAFDYCKNIKNVYSTSKDPAMLSDGVRTAFQNAEIHIPAGSLEKYMDKNWPTGNVIRDAMEKCPRPKVYTEHNMVSFSCDVPEAKIFIDEVVASAVYGFSHGAPLETPIKADGHYALSFHAEAPGYQPSEQCATTIYMSVGVRGDHNLDGEINVGDAIELQNILLGK